MKDRQSHKAMLTARFAVWGLFAISCQALALPTEKDCVDGGGAVATRSSGYKQCIGGKLDQEALEIRAKGGAPNPGVQERPNWGADVKRPPQGCEPPLCAQAGRTGPTNPLPRNIPAVLAGLSCREGGYAEYKNQHFECKQGKWQPQSVSSRRRTQPICIIHCHRENGVLICYGNGPQCDDVDPWGR